MEKSNENLLTAIRAVAFPDELSAITVRLAVAKNVFSLAATVYFFLYLSAVGGWHVDITAKATFLVYPAFLLSACVLAYELSSFSVRVYAEKFGVLRYIALFLCILLFLSGIVIHFKLISLP